MGRSEFLKIPYLHASWLCNDVADTARRRLLPREVRQGGTLRNHNAGNDQLVLGVYRRNGHPFLRAIVQQMMVMTGWSEGRCLAVVSECVGYRRNNGRGPIRNGQNLWKRFETPNGVRVKDAIHWVKDNTNVGQTCIVELACKYFAKRMCDCANPFKSRYTHCGVGVQILCEMHV